MKTRIAFGILIAAGLGTANPALADCTVKYKAKRDNPLKLEAGEASLPTAACQSRAAAAAALAPQLQQRGWTLLAITAILPSG